MSEVMSFPPSSRSGLVKEKFPLGRPPYRYPELVSYPTVFSFNFLNLSSLDSRPPDQCGSAHQAPTQALICQLVQVLGQDLKTSNDLSSSWSHDF